MAELVLVMPSVIDAALPVTIEQLEEDMTYSDYYQPVVEVRNGGASAKYWMSETISFNFK